MRSFMMGSLVAAMVMTMAATGSAQDTAPRARPKLDLAPALRVVGFHRAGSNGAYAGGALSIAIDVENTGVLAAESVAVKLSAGSEVMEGKLSIPGHATRTLVLQDAEGLPMSCEPKAFAIELSGAGAPAGARKASIQPTCKFTSTIESTWNQMTPDHVEAEKTGNVYLASASIAAQPVCGQVAPTLKVRVVSHAAKSSPSLIIQERESNASEKVRAQTYAAFPLAPNEEKEVTLYPVALTPHDAIPTRLKLAIVDWTKSLGGHTSSGGIFINTTRSCSLDFGLE